MALISGLFRRPLDNDGKQQRLDIVNSESELEGNPSKFHKGGYRNISIKKLYNF